MRAVRRRPERPRDAVRHIVVKKGNRHVEEAAKLEQAAGAGAIGLALVLLYLLKGKTQGLAQLVLTEPEQSATQTNPAADVDIHRVRRPGRMAARRSTATAEWINLFHCCGSSSRELD